jgi:hypothetical protein
VGRSSPPTRGSLISSAIDRFSRCLVSRGPAVWWHSNAESVANLEQCEPRGRNGGEQLAAMVPCSASDGEGCVDVSKGTNVANARRWPTPP